MTRKSGGGSGAADGGVTGAGVTVADADSTLVGGWIARAAATTKSCFATRGAACAGSPLPRLDASAATIARAPNAPASATHRACRVHRRHQSVTNSTPAWTVTPATGVGITTVHSESGVLALPNNWMSAACSHRWFQHRYDRMGRPDTVLDPNGAQLVRTYDAQDRMVRRLEACGNLGPIAYELQQEFTQAA